MNVEVPPDLKFARFFNRIQDFVLRHPGLMTEAGLLQIMAAGKSDLASFLIPAIMSGIGITDYIDERANK